MKNKRLLVGIIVVIIVILAVFFVYLRNSQPQPIDEPIIPVNTSVTYRNTEFGFTFALPESWRGYSVVETTWEGNPLSANTSKQLGTKFLIRNPNWTVTLPYQDIPILIFTRAQWDLYLNERFAISAAPIQASELARNNIYVFALPPRWNFTYDKGYEEAEAIVQSQSLQAFTIQEAGQQTTTPSFVWSYEKAISVNPDGQPNTNVFLSARYPNALTQKKLIATVGGSCNDVTPADVDSLLGTTNAQCYGAGLGYRFKIIQGQRSYLVQQKTFEEALPGYTPPVYQYKTVAEFPFSNQ